ncbi:hypothetical protein [Streptomyces mutomycini]|nr:hypothetical protein [Streptomyces mutomycini]
MLEGVSYFHLGVGRDFAAEGLGDGRELAECRLEVLDDLLGR